MSAAPLPSSAGTAAAPRRSRPPLPPLAALQIKIESQHGGGGDGPASRDRAPSANGMRRAREGRGRAAPMGAGPPPPPPRRGGWPRAADEAGRNERRGGSRPAPRHARGSDARRRRRLSASRGAARLGKGRPAGSETLFGGAEGVGKRNWERLGLRKGPLRVKQSF